MILRDYQQEFENNIFAAWDAGVLNVLGVLSCGGGKTLSISSIIKKTLGIVFVIAHRQELIQQISCTLARWGIPHRIIAPDNVIKWICKLHVEITGNCYYDPSAPCIVAGVDTLMSRYGQYKGLLNQCKLWVVDEAHHLLRSNKWGKAIKMVPNARGLGMTATPIRADGKGLGRHVDGVFDHMVIGPTARDLINARYLCDYRIFNPPSDLNLDNVAVSKATGDFNPNQLKIATRKSHMVGDVVQHYLRIAPGKQGATFATDIETAMEIASDFRAHGIPAEIVTGKTKARERVEIFRRFELREIQQIVNVDIMGEGVDIPILEVVSFARATESLGLFIQQFMRPQRPTESMEPAIIIDHVGNVARHGLPDAPRKWSLDRRERGAKGKRDPDIIPVRTCLNPLCMSVYEAIYSHCPYCGKQHVPAIRSGPEYVDGDLIELDPETLAEMRGEIALIDTPAVERRGIIGASIAKNHRERQEAQLLLRDSIRWWAGHWENLGSPKSEIYRRFYFKFGYDMLTAQTLNKTDAKALAININIAIDEMVNKG